MTNTFAETITECVGEAIDRATYLQWNMPALSCRLIEETIVRLLLERRVCVSMRNTRVSFSRLNDEEEQSYHWLILVIYEALVDLCRAHEPSFSSKHYSPFELASWVAKRLLESRLRAPNFENLIGFMPRDWSM